MQLSKPRPGEACLQSQIWKHHADVRQVSGRNYCIRRRSAPNHSRCHAR